MEINLLKNHFPEVSETQLEQLRNLNQFILDWNEKVNVISRKDTDNFFERHVLHSLAIAKFMSFKKGSDLLDLGTGGGFPGLPLAILFPECNFKLVDSIGKKVNVVNDLAEKLKLENVTGIHDRVENIEGKYDFVVTRAVAKLKVLNKWIRTKIKQESNHKFRNGIICLKGGDLTEELKPFRKSVSVSDIYEFFPYDFFKTKKIIYMPIAHK